MRRENFNSYERLLTTDLNAISLEIYNTVLDRLVASMSGGETGFVLGGGLVVTRNSATELAVTAGEALVKRTTIPVGQGAYCTVGIAANTTVTVPGAHASLNRIDILVLNPTDTTISSQIRDIRIGGADAVTPQTVAKVLEFLGTPLLVVGTPNASPVPPAVPTNCLLLSEILVTAVSGVVSNASITEKAKRFELTQVSPAGVYLGDLDSAASGGTVNIGTTNASTVNIATGAGTTTINLGGAGDTVVIDGTLTTVNTTNLDVSDKNITVNKGGLAASGGLAGISIEEGGSATGYIRTRTDRAAIEIKVPATAGDIELVPGVADLVLTSTSTSNRSISFPDVSGTLVTSGGSGTANQVLGVNSGATSNEYKTLTTGTTGTDFAIAHSAGGIAFNLPDASATNRGVVTTGPQTIAGAKSFSGAMAVTDGTASTSTTTGALVVTGGVGVGGRVGIGGRVVIDDATASTSTNTGALVVTGGVGVGGQANVGGVLTASSGTTATSTTTGALVVTGGAGITGTLFAGSGIQTPGGAVEVGLGRGSDGAAFVDLTSVLGETDFSARLIRNGGANGVLGLYQKGTGTVEIRNSVDATTGNGIAVQGFRAGAPGTGYVGETFVGTNYNTRNGILHSAEPGGGVNVSSGVMTGIISVNLTPGVWLLTGKVYARLDSGGWNKLIAEISTVSPGTYYLNHCEINPDGTSFGAICPPTCIAAISASTAYWLYARADHSGTVRVLGNSDAGGATWLTAVRIA